MQGGDIRLRWLVVAVTTCGGFEAPCVDGNASGEVLAATHETKSMVFIQI